MTRVESRKEVRHRYRPATSADLHGAGGRAIIESLPDSVMLNIFYFYRAATMDNLMKTWEWHRLVHVCRRWRYTVLTSPPRLDLHLLCTERTPVKETLDVWPALPIRIIINTQSSRVSSPPVPRVGDNIIAALEHHDRVHEIQLRGLSSLVLGRFITVTQEPFPALTSLWLQLKDNIPPPLPDAFLGRSAPRLQRLLLDGIPFPALPELLLTASNLIDLRLFQIPNTGYISPEAMVTGLSALMRLESLVIEFQSPVSHPDRTRRRSASLPRVMLPALTWLELGGVSEYFEDVVAQVEAPLLDYFKITFFHQLTFDVPELSQFIDRAAKLKSLGRAVVVFNHHDVKITLYPPEGTAVFGRLQLGISCGELKSKVTSMAQICAQSLPFLPSVEQLNFHKDPSYSFRPDTKNGIENRYWLELLRPFTAVQTLHISDGLVPFVVPALQGLGWESVMELLPALHDFYLWESQPSGHAHWQQVMQPFVTIRQIFNRPVTVHNRVWDPEWASLRLDPY